MSESESRARSRVGLRLVTEAQAGPGLVGPGDSIGGHRRRRRAAGRRRAVLARASSGPGPAPPPLTRRLPGPGPGPGCNTVPQTPSLPSDSLRVSLNVMTESPGQLPSSWPGFSVSTRPHLQMGQVQFCHIHFLCRISSNFAQFRAMCATNCNSGTCS